MILNSLHVLLTYKCTLECDHCFVWGSPFQEGTLTLEKFNIILEQAKELGTIKSIYFEGGEPFLYYPLLIAGVHKAWQQGFKTGVVSNGYWAKSIEVALEKLRPFANILNNLTISSDLFHQDKKFRGNQQNALEAARILGIDCYVIEIAQPNSELEGAVIGQLPPGASGVMYRGRAASKLVDGNALYPWETFTNCPYENLRDPGRVHLDPQGYLHLCQGISLGNIFETPLKEILEMFDPDTHPVAGPLNRGGPAELCRVHGFNPGEQQFADACHLCYRSREALRGQFPEVLAPDQVYGIYPNGKTKEHRQSLSQQWSVGIANSTEQALHIIN